MNLIKSALATAVMAAALTSPVSVGTGGRDIRQGVIMPKKNWNKRKKRLKMQGASRKANRK